MGGGEKRWGGRGGKELKIKGRACSSTCSISAMGTSSSGSLFCLSTYVMEMTFPELLKEVDIYAASDCRLEFKIVTEGGREDRRDRGGEIRGRGGGGRRREEKRWAHSGKEICL